MENERSNRLQCAFHSYYIYFPHNKNTSRWGTGGKNRFERVLTNYYHPLNYRSFGLMIFFSVRSWGIAKISFCLGSCTRQVYL